MRLAILATLLVVPVVATAQVYTWKDASGKVHYADQPPADRKVDARTLRPSLSDSDDVPVAAKAAAEKKDAAAKQAKESGEKAAQAEQERADDAIRQENCNRARQNLAGIESGQIRYRVTGGGEREALDGDARDSELAGARRAVEINCAPKPAAKK
jgi:hypothetical protein